MSRAEKILERLDGIHKDGFELEGRDWGLDIISNEHHASPSFEAKVYSNLENYGKRGKKVTLESFRFSWDARSSTAWAHTLLSRVKDYRPNTAGNVVTAIKDFEKYMKSEGVNVNVSFYKDSIRGVDIQDIPTPENINPEDKSGEVFAIRYSRPFITISNKVDNARLATGFQKSEIEVPWKEMKKILPIADQIVSLKTNKELNALLSSKRVQHTGSIRMMPGFD